MTKRRPIPDAVKGLVEESQEKTQDAIRCLRTVIYKRLDFREQERMISQALDKLHEVDKKLEEILSTRGNGHSNG